MRIAVVRVGSIVHFPPAVSLVASLLDLGHTVDFMGGDVDQMPEYIKKNGLYTGIEIGAGGSLLDRAASLLSTHRIVQNHISNHMHEIDVVWTTTDISARVLGSLAFKCTHVMQLSELVEYVPLIKKGESRLHSSRVIQMARHAAKVVVPEYNRAHIQKVWWDLPEIPRVLPNKPYPDPVCENTSKMREEVNLLSGKRVLLYQGVYEADRALSSIVDALDFLDSNYVLALMGKPVISGSAEIESLLSRSDRVIDLGFHPAPSHLEYTRLGHIGLLPYVPGKSNRFSSLNALYCAPNKIWEYAMFGLPMIGSNVPGLAFEFEKNEIGLAVDIANPYEIADAVKGIELNYQSFSTKSKSFYNDLDFKACVQEILESV